jgi:hypothetical protein
MSTASRARERKNGGENKEVAAALKQRSHMGRWYIKNPDPRTKQPPPTKQETV